MCQVQEAVAKGIHPATGEEMFAGKTEVEEIEFENVSEVVIDMSPSPPASIPFTNGDATATLVGDYFLVNSNHGEQHVIPEHRVVFFKQRGTPSETS